MTDTDDILLELTNNELKELALIYEKYKNELPHLHSFFDVCIRSKELGMLDFVHVYSPRGCWKEDGTFIASMPLNAHDIVFHSLDPSGANLVEGFAKTKRFKFLLDPARDYTCLYAVHDMFCSKIFTLFSEVLHHEVCSTKDVQMYSLDKEKALHLDNVCPSEVYVKELSHQDLSTIISTWSFSFPAAEQSFKDCLKLTAGFAVFLKSTDQMVSWVAASCLGQMTALHTADGHRRKGYAQLVVKRMARYLAEKGFSACATVIVGNTPSERMMEGLGFQKLFKCQYLEISNKY